VFVQQLINYYLNNVKNNNLFLYFTPFSLSIKILLHFIKKKLICFFYLNKILYLFRLANNDRNDAHYSGNAPTDSSDDGNRDDDNDGNGVHDNHGDDGNRDDDNDGNGVDSENQLSRVLLVLGADVHCDGFHPAQKSEG
jgi:hypothetical protein